MPWPPSLRACLTDVSSRFRRDCAPNPTKALRGDPWEPHSAPAGRALWRARRCFCRPAWVRWACYAPWTILSGITRTPFVF